MIDFKYKQIEFKWLNISLYNKFCFGLFTLGTTLIADSFKINWWNLFAFNASANDIGITYNQVDETHLFELFLGISLVVISILLAFLRKKYEKWYKDKYPRNLLAIKQQGLQSISFPNFNKKTAGKDFGDFTIHPISVDEINFDQQKQYQEAIEKQRQIVADINSLKNDHINTELAYWGITRIPLAFSLGKKVSDTQVVHAFDFNRKKTKMESTILSWLKNKKTKPAKFVVIKSSVSNTSSEDVILSISATFNVSKPECLKVVTEYNRFYELSLSKIGNGNRDRFNTISDINALFEEFRQVMDEISLDTNIKTVHLFYAGPNSLAFKFGTVYSEAIHPNIRVYNYNRNDSPCFSWSYDAKDDSITKHSNN